MRHRVWFPTLILIIFVVLVVNGSLELSRAAMVFPWALGALGAVLLLWEIVKEVETTHLDGSTTVDTVKSYIHEKGSGLCYKDASGSYVPAVAEWRETPDGFVIDRCAYGLAIGRKISMGFHHHAQGTDGRLKLCPLEPELDASFLPAQLTLWHGEDSPQSLHESSCY